MDFGAIFVPAGMCPALWDATSGQVAWLLATASGVRIENATSSRAAKVSSGGTYFISFDLV